MRKIGFFVVVTLVSISCLSFGILEIGETHQAWLFDDPALGTMADPVTGAILGIMPEMFVSAPYPIAPGMLDYYPGVGQEYQEFWGDMPGVLPLSGTIEIEIPNFDFPNPVKEIFMTIFWASQVVGTEPIVSEIFNLDTEVTLIDELPVGPTGEPVGDGEWIQSTYLIEIWPNPDFEVVRIDGAIMVDAIFIDTYCVPEPATLTMLGLGALSLLRRKK